MAFRDPLSLVFLGCGLATRLHSKTLAKLDPTLRRAYASRDPARALAACAKHRGVRAYGSYEEALDDATVDVVFVTTPPSSHLAWTLRALAAGKDVIVEKPAFLRAADVAAVRQACAKSGRRVLVAENYYYKPLATRLRALIEDDVVGDVLFVLVNATKRQRTSGWRDDQALAGGGALFEGGIHWINLLANIGLDLQTARGLLPTPLAGPLERSMLVTLTYREGAVGALAYSWEVPALINGVHLSTISGRRGSITFESNGLFIWVNGRSRRLLLPGVGDLAGSKAMFSDFLAALRTEQGEPAMNLARAERDLRLVEAIYRSVELGDDSDAPSQQEAARDGGCAEGPASRSPAPARSA